jgi:hypothetical protein
MPRLATSGTAGIAGRLGSLGAAAAVGAAATAAAVVGAPGASDVESHRQRLGVLQQRSVDFDLTLRAPDGCRRARLACRP